MWHMHIQAARGAIAALHSLMVLAVTLGWGDMNATRTSIAHATQTLYGLAQSPNLLIMSHTDKLLGRPCAVIEHK